MIEERLARIVRQALEGARGELGIPDELGDVVIEVEASRRKEFGDFTTNVALSLAARRNAGLGSRACRKQLQPE